MWQTCSKWMICISRYRSQEARDSVHALPIDSGPPFTMPRTAGKLLPDHPWPVIMGETMSNLVECPACERRLRVPDTLIGKKVKCPSCSQMFTTADPGNGSSPAPSSASDNPVRFQAQQE